jgi:hypothetical protein
MNHAAQEYHRLEKTGLADDRLRPYLVACPTCAQPRNRVCISPLGVPLSITHEARQDLARELVA